MKILGAIWFTEMGSLQPIGIVVGKSEHTGEMKAYIGTGRHGIDEGSDAQEIAYSGAKFTGNVAMALAAKLLPIDTNLLAEQARQIGLLLAPSQREHMGAEITEAVEGVWSLLHSILDAVEKGKL